MAHGSKYHRHAGSNGACSDPSRVFKGKKMPGHMGAVKVTVQNLEVIQIDLENNVILIKGNVPGPKNSLVFVKSSVKHTGEKEEALDLITFEVKEENAKEENTTEEVPTQTEE